MEAVSPIIAMALIAGGLVGQAFELKKIRTGMMTDEQLNPKNIFADRRNFKWYALIVAGLIVSFIRF